MLFGFRLNLIKQAKSDAVKPHFFIFIKWKFNTY